MKYFNNDNYAVSSSILFVGGDTVTLTGTFGTANITVNGVDYLSTFYTDLTTTASNWVGAHKESLALRGIVSTSSAAVISLTILRSHIVTSRIIATISNAAGDLSGSLTATITPDFNVFRVYRLSISVPTTINAPLNIRAGQYFRFEIFSSEPLGVTWTSFYKFSDGVLYTQVDSLSIIEGRCNASAEGGHITSAGLSATYKDIYNVFNTTQSTLFAAAQNTFVNTLVGGGVWAKFDGFFMLDYANQDYGDLVLNWITLDSGTITNPVTGESGVGIFTDKKTGRISTGYNPSTDKVNMAADDVFMCGYFLDEIHDRSYSFGCYDGVNGLLFYPKRANGNFSWSWANTTTYKSVLNTKSVSGLCGFSQLSGAVQVYSGGEKLSDETVTPAALPNADLSLFMANIEDVYDGGTMNRLKMFMYGAALTEAEFTILKSAADAYVVATEVLLSYYETDKIYYKRESFHVDCQRDDYRFGTDLSNIYLSADGGQTYKSLTFSDTQNIEMSYIFDNGDVMFGTRTKMYRAAAAFASYSEITVTDIGGGAYTPHVPANANYPGNYFRQLNAINPHYISGTEVVVWGNYGNIGDGANPVSVYYTKDNGVTIKIAYKFGQNSFYRDDGTYNGGETGTLLGDSGNATYCRHVHSIACDEANAKFYVTTGDFDRAGPIYENHWLEGEYTIGADSWSWNVLVSDSNSTRYKTAGVKFVDGYLYFASDATDGLSAELGIFKCLVADLDNTSNHVKLYTAEAVLTDLQLSGNNLISANAGTADNKVVISNDLGNTWEVVTLSKLSGSMRILRIHAPNSDGWFRADMEHATYYDSYPVYIKFK